MKESKIDIIEEYERLFGSARKVDLFSPEEDYYNGLRQEIISTEIQWTPNRNELFPNVQLIPYPLYALEQSKKSAIDDGKRLFYISHSNYGQPDYCNAVGYFNVTNSLFVILQYSHITTRAAIFCKRKGAQLKREGENWYLMKNEYISSAEKAAIFVTGESVSWGIWKDESGKSLDEIYSESASLEKKETERTTPAAQCKVNNETKHFFFISDYVYGVNAYGYYDQETNCFYISKGSLIAGRIISTLLDENTIAARNRFAKEACERYKDSYRVKITAKCSSPSAAATYVLGRKVNGWIAWKDQDGVCLKDYYQK